VPKPGPEFVAPGPPLRRFNKLVVRQDYISLDADRPFFSPIRQQLVPKKVDLGLVVDDPLEKFSRCNRSL
jgi:hypothetical protein